MSLQEETIFIQKDKDKQLDFIEKYMKFITSCIFNVLGKEVRKEDDEFSIALSAFNEAIMQYDSDKGDFYDFAEKIIHSSLNEKLGTAQKIIGSYKEQVVENDATDNDSDVQESELEVVAETEDKTENQDVEIEVEEQTVKTEPETKPELQEETEDIDIDSEIKVLSKQLEKMQITFSDLAQCSPQKKKTKDRILDAAVYIINNNTTKLMVLEEGILPVSKILDNTNVDRKILDKHRKYIIAYVLVLLGDYPGLSKYITGEQGDKIWKE